MAHATRPTKLTAMGAAAKVMIVIVFTAVYFKSGSAQNLARSCGPTGAGTGAGPCTAAQSNHSFAAIAAARFEGPAPRAIDGDTTTCSSTTADDRNKPEPWWRVDFGRQVQVGGLKVQFFSSMLGFSVFVGNYRDDPQSNSPCATDQPAPRPAVDVVCNTTLQGQYLFIRKSSQDELTLQLCEVQVFPPPPPNLARMCGKDGKQACKAVQSSNNTINKFSVASNANDGVISQNNLSTCSQTSLNQQDYSPWWRVDFGRQVQVTGLQVYSAEGPNALNGFDVYVGSNEVLYSPTGPGPVLLNTPCEIDQNASTSPVSVGATT
jgi:hypothetical protein